MFVFHFNTGGGFMRGLILFPLIFSMGLSTEASGLACSHIFGRETAESPNPLQKTIELNFEQQGRAHQFVFSTLKETSHIRVNSHYNESLKNIADVLNQLLDNYISVLQLTQHNLSSEGRSLLTEYLSRHQAFFVHLMNGNRDAVIHLVQLRIRALQKDSEPSPNAFPTIGFIQPDRTTSRPQEQISSSEFRLPSIGFIQSKSLQKGENQQVRPLPSIGFIQNESSTTMGPSSPLPTIGFIQPSADVTNSSQKPPKPNPIGFLQSLSETPLEISRLEQEVGYRFELVVNPKMGQFDVERSETVLGFTSN